MPTDLIIKEGTSANELYVIGDGQLQVSRSDGLVVAVLGRGNFFGEMPPQMHLEPCPRRERRLYLQRALFYEDHISPDLPHTSPMSPQARWRSSTKT